MSKIEAVKNESLCRRAIFLVLILICSILSAKSQWIGTTRIDNTAYFLFSARAERFDLDLREWLAPVPIPTSKGLPTAVHVDEDGLYVAFGKAVYRYNLDGDQESHLFNATTDVIAILTDAQYIFVRTAEFISIDKSTNTLVDTSDGTWYTRQGISIAPGKRKIFGRSSGISPSDIGYISYDESGKFQTVADSPHHGDYPSANQTWVFPGEAKVVDSSGTVYSADNLQFLASFGNPIDDIQFYGTDIPIILSGNSLKGFNAALLPTGSAELSGTPTNLYLNGDDALLFSSSITTENGISVETVPLSELNPPEPGEAVDPLGLPYTPNSIFLDRDGFLLLFSKPHQSVFRWDPATQQYLSTLPLVGVPEFAAYSAANHAVYLAYGSGLIQKLDLTEEAPQEEPFATLPDEPLGLATAGQYLFAVDPSGAWVSHYTFDSLGNNVETVDWNYYSREYVWSEQNQKMYFFRDDTSPNDLLWEEINSDGVTYAGEPPGGIGMKVDSPLHGSEGFTHPIRVSPDGNIVVLGSGVVHDASSLERLPLGLANEVTDIAWIDSALCTMRTITSVTQYQKWTGATLALGSVKQYPGTAFRMLAHESGYLVGISISNEGIPSFYLLDDEFDVVPPSVGLAPPAVIDLTQPTAGEQLIQWHDISGELEYVVERLSDGGEWEEVGFTGISETRYTDDTVEPGEGYAYRVIAVHGNLRSVPSDVLVTNPGTPTGLMAEVLGPGEIQLTWVGGSTDDGYALERRLGEIGSGWTQLAMLDADQTMYLDEGLSPYTIYQYRLRAFNSAGESSWSQVEARTDPTLPGQPVATSPSQTATTVTISWAAIVSADLYIVERRNAEEWTQTTAASETTFTDTDLAPASTYDYRVKARNAVGDSPWSTVISVTTAVPSTPGTFAVSVSSHDTVEVSWNSVPEVQEYVIERRLGLEGQWEGIATVPGTTVSFIDLGLQPGTAYFYRIGSIISGVASSYSGERAVTTLPLPLPPTPRAVNARPDGSDGIVITWERSESVQQYVIQRTIADNAAWEDLVVLDGPTESFNDTGLSVGTSYSYRLAAIQDGVRSAYSESAVSAPLELVCLLTTDFSDESYPTWMTISGGHVIRDGGAGFPNGAVLWLGHGGERSLTLMPADLRRGGYIEIGIRGGSSEIDGSNFWDEPEPDEDVVVEYSSGGGTWSEFHRIDLSSSKFENWTSITLELPQAAQNLSTQIRIRQTALSSDATDVWAVDSLCLLAPPPPQPNLPPFVYAVSNTAHSVILIWGQVPEATEYVVYRTLDNDTWERVGKIGGEQLYFVDSGLNSAQVYGYRIQVWTLGNESELSETYFVTTLGILDEWLSSNIPDLQKKQRETVLRQTNRHGLSILEQYAYGLSPNEDRSLYLLGSEERGLPYVYFDKESKTLRATFIRRRVDRDPDVEYALEVSEDGISWTTDFNAVETEVLDEFFERVTFQDRTSSNSSKRKLARVRVMVLDSEL